MKYHMTEKGRVLANHCIDILGGKGLCLGEQNHIFSFYQHAPISVTVEGSNIITRCLMIFSQGVVRSHPYLLPQIQAASHTNEEQGLYLFDTAFWAHLQLFVSNTIRNVFDGFFSRLYSFIDRPQTFRLAYYHRYLKRFSATLLFFSDLSMVTIGSQMKKKELLSARLGDLFSHLYFVSALLKKYEQDQKKELHPIFRYAIENSFCDFQDALQLLIENHPSARIAKTFRFLFFPYGLPFQRPKDHLTLQVAELVSTQNAIRDHLTEGIYIRDSMTDLLCIIDETFKSLDQVQIIRKKLDIFSETQDEWLSITEKVEAAFLAGIISNDQKRLYLRYTTLEGCVLQVDDFDVQLTSDSARRAFSMTD